MPSSSGRASQEKMSSEPASENKAQKLLAATSAESGKLREINHADLFFSAGDSKQIRQGATETTNAVDIAAVANANEKCVEKVKN
jgi:hypothetical protein